MHLGHNRSVAEIADAAVDEDVHGIAVSSYQGGHMEFFAYLVEELARRGRPSIRVFGGGGGVIIPKEIAELESRSAWRGSSPPTTARGSASAGWRPRCAPSPERRSARRSSAPTPSWTATASRSRGPSRRSRRRRSPTGSHRRSARRGASRRVPVLGITGTGGSGKSSLTDELLRRFRLDLEDKLAIAVVAVDPTRRRGGGALLGDRIRMNAIDTTQVYFRSLGAGGAPGGHPRAPRRRRVGVRGVGRGPRRRRDPRHRAGRRGHRGARRRVALRDDARVRRAHPAREDRDARRRRRRRDQQVRAPRRRTTPCARSAARSRVSAARPARASRTSRSSGRSPRGSTTTASPRCTTSCAVALAAHGLTAATGVLADPGIRASTHADAIIAPDRVGYLGEIARTVRDYHRATEQLAQAAAVASALDVAASHLERTGAPAEDAARRRRRRRRRARPHAARAARGVARGRRALRVGRRDAPRPGGRAAPRRRSRARGSPASRSRRPPTPRASSATCARRTCRAGSRSPPGVFEFKRDDEDPTRMFAGEGDAERTNAGSTCSPRASPRRGCPRRSTRSPSTASTPTSAPTSSARSATPGSRWRPSRTWRSCTAASTSARRRRRSR